jgi:NADPH:quinone reductase
MMTQTIAQRRVARVPRAGGPDVLEVVGEDLQALKSGEVLVRVEAAGLNHAETLIRSGTYAVRLPFPYAAGIEGAGVIVDAAPDVRIPVGTRVCWTGVFGSCATFVTAGAMMLAPIPDPLSLEDGACLAHAGITATLLARVWPVDGSAVVVWGAAGAVGRILVATLAGRGVQVIGIASGRRVDDVKAVGAAHVVDRSREDVAVAVRDYTGGRGAAAVFDPVAAATFDVSLQMLAPRGCLINYGELSGSLAAIDIHRLFESGVFVTKFNGRRYVGGSETAGTLIGGALSLAVRNRALVSSVAARFSLDAASGAYRTLESNPAGKVLVLPHDRLQSGPSGGRL